MQKKFLFLSLAVAVALVLTAWVIYPGLYVYVPIAGTTDVYRVNRVTGVKQLASQWGWKTEAEYLALYSAQQDREEAAFFARVKQFEGEAVQGKIVKATWTGGRLTVRYKDGSAGAAVVNYSNQAAIERATEALLRHSVPIAD
jgi:hypothetical protein